MAASVQYLTNQRGERIGVQLSLKDYTDLQEMKKEFQQLRFLQDMVQALEFIEAAKAGKATPRDLDELLRESI
jgi:hypothetical protein